ncbi:NAD(P)/FAD-dependent oxidoreductase [Microbacteriaceae bacterium VKM Ac-2854]|nr:NAD(P)/FAD-dependent oxidoreductase [Microbacteriaceae bacterium VKM Ac-2854]
MIETRTDVLIVGAGFAGLGMAAALQRAGRCFLILEAADGVGGVWRENTYPGVACDVPSPVYAFSFRPEPGFARLFGTGEEIERYLQAVTAEFGLAPRLRRGETLTAAEWDDAAQLWRVTTARGHRYAANSLVLATGQFRRPREADPPGRFAGPSFHCARWDASVDLAGRRVAVIGTGASAVQFLPRIAPTVATLTIFQRHPSWLLARPDVAVPALAQEAFARVPPLHRAVRGALLDALEARGALFDAPDLVRSAVERLARRRLRRAVADPLLRAALTPTDRIGCRRVLLSNDYLPMFARPNVRLVASGARAVTEGGVLDGSGMHHPVDVVIRATGFDVLGAWEEMRIVGRAGTDLAERFRTSGLAAWHGIAVPGFPNLYLMQGPNTAAQSSHLRMIEHQAEHVLWMLAVQRSRGSSSSEIREEALERADARLRHRLASGVWGDAACAALRDARGVNRHVHPGSTASYGRAVRRIEVADYLWRRR